MNNKLYLGVIGLLIVMCAFLGYRLSQKSDMVVSQAGEIENLDIERERLELELERMMISYDTLSTQNAELNAEMAAQREEIEALLAKVKDRNWSIHKLKKEAATLREIMKGYVVTIDSLNTLNQNLMAENSNLNERVVQVEGQNVALMERQSNMEEIISTGQTLQAGNIHCSSVRLRSSGKQMETNRASKTEMLKSCFTLRRNDIAKKGEKELFLRILGPDGKALVSKEGAAEYAFDEGQGEYSVTRKIEYTGTETDVCMFYTIQNPLEKGIYKFYIYEASKLIGSAELELK